MKRIHWLIAAVLCTLVGVPYAASQGGFPTAPRFQTVAVNANHQQGWSATSSHIDSGLGSYYSAPGWGTGIVVNGYYDGSTWRCASASAASVGLMAEENTNPAFILYQSSAACTAAAQAVTMVTQSVGAKIASGTLNYSGTSCVVDSGEQNISGCTVDGSGDVTATIATAAGFTNWPSCVASSNAQSFKYFFVANAEADSGANLFINGFNTSATQVTAAVVNVICTGT